MQNLQKLGCHEKDSRHNQYYIRSYMLYTENICQGKILANHAGKTYWRGKCWRISNSQCIPYLFSVCANIHDVNLANGSQFAKFTNFTHTKIFPCTVNQILKYISNSQQIYAFSFSFCTSTNMQLKLFVALYNLPIHIILFFEYV